MSRSQSVHLSPLSDSFLIVVLRSINSSCEQQVDVDWINPSHHIIVNPEQSDRTQ